MTMQLRVTFVVYVLLCLCICLCNGAPPASPGTKFNDEEDILIIEELSKLLDGSTLLNKRDVWNKIAAKHKEKLIAKSEGFLKERSSDVLRGRFRKILTHKPGENKVTVPESLRQQINQANAFKIEQGGCDTNKYNKKENDFIIQELRRLSSTGKKLLSRSTMDALRLAHDEKRRAKTKGFEKVAAISSATPLRQEVCGGAAGLMAATVRTVTSTKNVTVQLLERFVVGSLVVAEVLYVIWTSYHCMEKYRRKIISTLNLRTTTPDLQLNATLCFAAVLERTVASFRNHLYLLKLQRKLPKEIIEKFEMPHRGASSSTSTAQNNQSETQQDDDFFDAIINNEVFDLDITQIDSLFT